MFDQITGIPVHVLVLHFFVVFAPVTALFAIALVKREWRRPLKWPVSILAVLTGGFAYVTKESGEQFKNRVYGSLTAADRSNSVIMEHVAKVEHHATMGHWAFRVAGIFMVIVIFAVWFVLTPNNRRKSSQRLTSATLVLVVLASLGLVGMDLYAGHSGAESVWQNRSGGK